MENVFERIVSRRIGQVGFLLAFCFLVFFVNLGRWDIWNPDEPRYAMVAKEMVDGGDWILMHLNGRNYAIKPPLFFWLIGFSSYLWQGFTSFSIRFPAALFGTLTVLLTFLMGKQIYGSRTGFISGLVLATSVEFAYLSTRANTDTTLTFFTTASLFCFLRWFQNRREGGSGKRSATGLAIYGFYMSMALATLVKGPVGFLLPLLVSLLYLAVQKDWKGVREMKLLPGMLLMTAVVLSWYAPAVWKGGREFFNQSLGSHTIDRYFGGWSKVRPFYYYLYNFPVDFLPWSLFLPAALVYGFSREAIEKRKEFLFLVTWFVVIFLFFSLSKGKRPLYLLPLYPAASLVIGKLWDDLISIRMKRFRHEWVTIPLYGFMGLTLLAGAAIPWVVSVKLPSYLSYSLPIAFLMVGGSLVLFILYRFRNYGAILFMIIGMVAGGFFYTSRVVFPLINPYKSARYITEEVKSRILPGERLGIYRDLGSAPYNFYTGIVPILELDKKEDLFHFLQSSGRVFCFLRVGDFDSFQRADGWPKVHLIARRKVGSNDVVLISNQNF